MKIHFCDLCNESVPQSDLDEGRAYFRKGRVVCANCDRAMSHAASGEPAVASASGAAGLAPTVVIAEGTTTSTTVFAESAAAAEPATGVAPAVAPAPAAALPAAAPAETAVATSA